MLREQPKDQGRLYYDSGESIPSFILHIQVIHIHHIIGILRGGPLFPSIPFGQLHGKPGISNLHKYRFLKLHKAQLSLSFDNMTPRTRNKIVRGYVNLEVEVLY